MRFGGIWRCDNYDLRKYSPKSIDYFLDIGGCEGTTSVLFKSIDPFATVIGLEPCINDYALMKVSAGTWDVQCYNMALGNGEPMCFEYRKSGGHRLYTEREKKWWPEGGYMVESRTLPQLMEQFGIKGRYIIKIDCEGGERFILDDPLAIDIIKGCVQFNLEYHRGFGGKTERWHEWFGNFADTHDLFMRTKKPDAHGSFFAPSTGPVRGWRSEYMLVRKKDGT